MGELCEGHKPCYCDPILIAIAVIAGVFVLRRFILLSTTSGQQNMLQIQDMVLYRTIKYYDVLGENYMTVTLQISVKNVGQRVVTLKNITVDNIYVRGFKEVSLNPGQVYTATYDVLDNVKYSPDWDTGTEHVVTVYYQVLGQPDIQKISAKASVQ